MEERGEPAGEGAEIEVRAFISSVVCGIDGSPQGLQAARAAREIARPGARIWGVCVWNPAEAMHAGIHASEVAIDLRRRAGEALQAAEREVEDLEPILMRGGEVAGMLSAAANLRADLISVGATGSSRAAGVIFGSVASAIAHHAPCSVLIAREGEDGVTAGPILLAGDGSAEALDAARVAAAIAARSDATVVNLSIADEPEDAGAVAAQSVALIEASGRKPVVRVERGSPHRRIVEVATEIGASLVVVGSRGKTGLKALGSVSERVAHRAPGSVLIVRRPAHPERESPVG